MVGESLKGIGIGSKRRTIESGHGIEHFGVLLMYFFESLDAI